MNFDSRWLSRYGLAAVAVAVGFGLRLAATTWVGPGLPTYITFYPAVMLAALMGGFMPGLLATALSLLVASYWVLEPAGLAVESSVDRLGLVIFAGMGLFMSAVADLYRRNRDKAAAYDREAALRESQARLAAFAEATFEGIVESEAGRIIDCNEQFAQMFGCSVAELKGVEIARLAAPEDRDRVMTTIQVGRESAIEHAAIRKDGTRIVIEAHGRPVSPGSPRRHSAVRDITERKRAEETLRESEIRSRRFYESGLLGVIYWNMNGEITEANDKFLEMTGYDREDLASGRVHWMEMTPPEYRHLDEQSAEELKATGVNAKPFEKEYIRRDGTRIPILVAGAMLDEARFNGVAFVLDITDRKRAEQSVRDSEDRLRFALETSHTGAWDLDLVDHTAFRSAEHDRVFGYPELLPQWTYEMFLEHILPEDRAAVDGTFSRATATHGDWDFECRIRRTDGEIRWIWAAGRHRPDAAGNLRRMAGIIQDITERKQAEEEVRTHREWLRVTLTSIGDAVIAGDTETRITFMNPVAAALTGWTEEEALEQPMPHVFKIINEETGEPADPPCIRAMTEKRVVGLANHTALITKDGREIPIEDSAAPILDAAGDVAGVVLVFHDVTEKRRALDALRKAHNELEIRVQERTAELEHSMEMVQAERTRFQDVLDKLPAYLILLSPDYHVPFANRFFEDRFGKSDGRRCFEYLFQRTEPCDNCETYKVLKTHAPLRWEWTGPDGRNYDIYDFPFTDVDGTNLIMEVGLDTTVRKQAEVELEKHRHNLEEIVQERTTQLEAANQQLQAELFERQRAQEALGASRLAALNLMEDAVEARRRTEQASTELQRSRDRSDLLAETMAALLQSSEPQRLVETLCTRVMEYLDCQAFFNFLADEDAGRLRLNAYAGIPEEEAVKLEWLDYGVAVCGCVAAECSRIIAEHIPTTQDPRTDLIRSFGIQAYACHPLLGPGSQVIGTLSFGTRNRETFEEDDLALMKSVADHVAIAMDRMNSLRALQRAHDELEQRVQERTADLRRASLYARSLLEASLDPLVTISPEGKITDVNQATELATGVSSLDLIDSDFSNYFTEPEKAREGYQRVLADGLVTDYPLTIRHITGSTIDVFYNATTYANENGDVQGVFAAARDVTQRKHMEEALRDSEKFLAEAQRIAHLGGWDWDIVADVLSWSDEMYRLFGFEPRAFPVDYARFLESVHPEDRELVKDAVAQALQGTRRYDVGYRIVLPDKSERVLHAQAETILNDHGEPARMVGTVLDITEQVRAQEEAKLRQQQLVQADKMVSLGILVSGVAHEINNPNHSIMANVTSLREVWHDVQPILAAFYKDFGDFVLGGFDYTEARDKFPAMFDNALASSRRIELIVTELRDFARFSPKEQMAAVDANAVVESAVVLVSNMIKKATDHFVVQPGTSLPPVFGNRQRIEQVVINLIQNACRALSSREKSVTVTTRHVSGTKTVIIEVDDEGAGIPEEDLKHLGDPFFTTNRGAGGMGLGLWVSFNIVHEHGGTLTFSSKKGQGTRATLALPVLPAQGHAENPSAATQEG